MMVSSSLIHHALSGGLSPAKTLETGARLFVYTDGVPEAADEGEKLFGTDRLLTALREAENGTPEDVLHKVEESVHAFVGNAAQFDDLTMLCVQFHGRSTV